MSRYRRVWRAVLIALAGAGALSGCYYDPYTGGWYGSPPYYAYPMASPYGPGYPYPYPPGQGPNPAQGYAPGQGPYPTQGYPPGQGPYPAQGYPPGTPPPGYPPVQRAPLSPSS